MLLKDKVIIITGGGQGIGRVFAHRMVKEGAKVVIAEINAESARSVVKELKSLDGDAIAIQTDVSNPESAEAMAQETVDKFGRIDVLVNNAAIYYGLQMKPFEEIGLDEWRQLMAVNVDGLFYCSRAVVPSMREQGSGRIINLTSGATCIFVLYLTNNSSNTSS